MVRGAIRRCLCLLVLMLNVPVNNFSVMSGRSHRFLGITSSFWGVNVSLLKDTTRQRYHMVKRLLKVGKLESKTVFPDRGWRGKVGNHVLLNLNFSLKHYFLA